jgi:hypothetical protein
MKALVISLGLVMGSAGVFMAYAAVGHAHEKEQEIRHVQAELLDLEQKISFLKGLRQRPEIPLEKAYVAAINDMNVLARAHHVIWSISIQGVHDGDVEKNADSSLFPGLREVRFQGVFSGLARRGIFLSLFDALSAFEEGAPVLFRSVTYEKDALMFDLAVIGP